MIFLDFDGVLFDTAKEAYAVAVLASGKYNSIDEIDFKTEHYQNFRKLRYLISPAWNYKYLLDELEQNKDLIKIKNNFFNSISNISKKDYEEFENNFFSVRNYLKKNHYEKWFKLNIPFPFLYKIMFLFSEYENLIYIVTTKDKETVLKLLSLENIEFNEKRIFDKEDYQKFGNKKNIIESLLSKDTKNIFIDDSDNHIKECSKIKNLKFFQPDWGYVGLESKTTNIEIIINEINNLLGK